MAFVPALVLTAADLVDDPHLKQREFLRRSNEQVVFALMPGGFRIPGMSWKSGTPLIWASTTKKCCARFAGLSKTEIDALRRTV